MSGHLGADLAALVDGELDHAARERVLRHLVHCPPCRAEVAAQRLLKTSLRSLATAAPEPDLAARLRAVAARPDAGPWDRAPGLPVRRPLPRAAVGGAVLAVGLGAVLVLVGPQADPGRGVVEAGLIGPAGPRTQPVDRLPLPRPAEVSTGEVSRAGLAR